MRKGGVNVQYTAACLETRATCRSASAGWKIGNNVDLHWSFLVAPQIDPNASIIAHRYLVPCVMHLARVSSVPAPYYYR